MGVTEINSEAEFNTKVVGEKNSLVVVDFTATWCGPCQMISPKFAELSETHTDVLFFKVDVDEQNEIAASAEVSAMPTFHFYKAGKKVAEVVGASLDEIKQNIEQHK